MLSGGEHRDEKLDIHSLVGHQGDEYTNREIVEQNPSQQEVK
jgi:hypothetical protein